MKYFVRKVFDEMPQCLKLSDSEHTSKESEDYMTQGFVMNMQPSEAEVGFDIRLPPTADPDAMRKRILEEWAPALRNMTFGTSFRGFKKHARVASL